MSKDRIPSSEGHRLPHSLAPTSVAFDDPNLVSAVGLVPVLALADAAALCDLVDVHLTVATDTGANAGSKVTSLVGGMVVGADSIDDMAMLRHGGMRRLFTAAYAPSTLGSFLRAVTFGHVRQLDAVASRFLIALAGLSRLLGPPSSPPSSPPGRQAGYALVDVDDTIIEVPGHAKQGVGFGYSGERALNALLATLTTTTTAPVIVAQRLRRGGCGSPRGARRLVADTVTTSRRLLGPTTKMTVRMDSAFYGRGPVWAAIKVAAVVSVTVRMNPLVQSHRHHRRGRVDHHRVPRRHLRRGHRPLGLAGSGRRDAVHRVRLGPRQDPVGTGPANRAPDPDAHVEAHRAAGQDGLFDTWRFHAFFTVADPGLLDTVAADKTHRGHAVEQVYADLKHSALAHLPSGVFTANAAWLVLAVIAFNLTRAAASLTAPDLAKATTATLRRELITVPARIASSARRIILHLPTSWPWQTPWTNLFHRVSDPPSLLTA